MKSRAHGGERVHYRAKSIFESRSMWLNVISVIAAALAVPGYIETLPKEALPIIAILNPILNAVLRQYTVRPVAFIRPGKTKSVSVRKID